jgi:integrase
MGKRPSLIFETLIRLDQLKSVGVSRHTEKTRMRAQAKAQGERLPLVSPSTGRIHADTTLATYRAIALRYVQYVRRVQGVKTLTDLDAGADGYVAAYLEARVAAGDSPYTLATIRSALRMFHRPAYPPDEREARVHRLGAGVKLPQRRRAAITRSRKPVAMDDAFAAGRHTALVAFALACGLRRRELAAVRVGDVQLDSQGNLEILVKNGKGGRWRTAPVLPGHESAILDAIIGRRPEERIWPRIPVRLDAHSLRRKYAAALYSEGGRYPLPPSEGRLPAGSIDARQARRVAEALGHSRIDIISRHYLR